MANQYTLSPKESGPSVSFFTWVGMPKRPTWVSESIVRLGASQASTQIVKKQPIRQTSTCQAFFNTYNLMDQFISNITELPNSGRYKFTFNNVVDSETITINDLIINSVTYSWRRIETCILGGTFKYVLNVNISYIVDEIEQETT